MHVAFFMRAYVLVVLHVMCVFIQWQGAEGSPFQHQQADESLGPNSLEAKLALLFSLSLPHTEIHRQHNLKFEPNRAIATVTSQIFSSLNLRTKEYG